MEANQARRDDFGRRRAPGGTFSYEIPRAHLEERPPFCDSCPKCVDTETGTFVPYATETDGETLIAFYRHRRCGHQWSCHWRARWAHFWQQ